MTEGPGGGAGRIVVGVDGSPLSQQALRWGAHLAATFGAGLDAVTVWEFTPTRSWSSTPPDRSPDQYTRQVLDQTVQDVFGDQPPAGLRRLVREGGAAKVLLDASEGAIMVVVGSRGHGGFAGLMLGSVSASVSAHAACPVLVIHGDQAPPVQVRPV
jgi:nucleotide-binding universal stress UspA family protein